MAQAPTLADTYEIASSFDGLDHDSAEAVATMYYGDHDLNRAYVERMAIWVNSGLSDQEMYDSINFDPNPNRLHR